MPGRGRSCRRVLCRAIGWLATCFFLQVPPPCLNSAVVMRAPPCLAQQTRPLFCLRGGCDSAPADEEGEQTRALDAAAVPVRVCAAVSHVDPAQPGSQHAGLPAAQGRGTHPHDRSDPGSQYARYASSGMRAPEALDSRMHHVLARHLRRSECEIEMSDEDPMDCPRGFSEWTGASPQLNLSPLAALPAHYRGQHSSDRHPSQPHRVHEEGNDWTGAPRSEPAAMLPGLMRAQLAAEKLRMFPDHLPPVPGLQQVRRVLEQELGAQGAPGNEHLQGFEQPPWSAAPTAASMPPNPYGDVGGFSIDAPVSPRAATRWPTRDEFNSPPAPRMHREVDRELESHAAFSAMHTQQAFMHDDSPQAYARTDSPRHDVYGLGHSSSHGLERAPGQEPRVRFAGHWSTAAAEHIAAQGWDQDEDEDEDEGGGRRAWGADGNDAHAHEWGGGRRTSNSAHGAHAHEREANHDRHGDTSLANTRARDSHQHDMQSSWVDEGSYSAAGFSGAQRDGSRSSATGFSHPTHSRAGGYSSSGPRHRRSGLGHSYDSSNRMGLKRGPYRKTDVHSGSIGSATLEREEQMPWVRAKTQARAGGARDRPPTEGQERWFEGLVTDLGTQCARASSVTGASWIEALKEVVDAQSHVPSPAIPVVSAVALHTMRSNAVAPNTMRSNAAAHSDGASMPGQIAKEWCAGVEDDEGWSGVLESGMFDVLRIWTHAHIHANILTNKTPSTRAYAHL